jgi:hypothetical protein
MTEEATPAKAYLRTALEGLGEVCEPLRGMRLKHWYVITTHTDDKGEEIMSRFAKTDQAPWTDRGLLTFALQQDEREWAEDDPDEPGDTYT